MAGGAKKAKNIQIILLLAKKAFESFHFRLFGMDRLNFTKYRRICKAREIDGHYGVSEEIRQSRCEALCAVAIS